MSHWQLFSASTAHAALHPNKLVVPPFVAQQAAMRIASGVAVFADDTLAGLATLICPSSTASIECRPLDV